MTPAPASHAELRSLAGRIAALLPARELAIFGGAAYAMLTPGSPASGDIDVAVRGTPPGRPCLPRAAGSKYYWVAGAAPVLVRTIDASSILCGYLHVRSVLRGSLTRRLW